MSSDLDEHGSEQPSVITQYSTLAPHAAYASSGEVTSLASFEIFSAAAALPVHDRAGRSPPRAARTDALLCRDVPKRTNTGRNLSLSAQNSPRTASQRVIFNPQHAKVVIFACAPALFVISSQRVRVFSKWELELGSPNISPNPVQINPAP